jgi:hypothetical protein
MFKYQKVLFNLFLFCFFVFGERVEIFKQGRIIPLAVKQNYMSMVEFPENISQVITSYPEGTASYSVVGNKFFFMLTGSWEGMVFVVGESGMSYPISIREVIDNPDVVLKVQAEIKKPAEITEFSQMENALKQLLREKIEQGLEEDINQEFFKDKNIIIRGRKLLRFTSYLGVIGEIENIAKTPVVIPITQIAIPNLVAISVDKEFLNPKEKTKAYFLFKRD